MKPVPWCTDGEYPAGSLVQATNGDYYGATSQGGADGGGTVFKITAGGTLTCSQERLPGRRFSRCRTARPVCGNTDYLRLGGAAVKILGTDLDGATSVTFDGTAATFTVVSPSLITPTVPTGATTGTVQVVTPGGTLSSSIPLRVLP